MLIVLDGHPGAGKTTLAGRLAEAGVSVIGEVLAADGAVVEGYGRAVADPEQIVANTPMVLDSDLAKHRLALGAAPSGTVLMDRNYVFTLAFCLVLGATVRAGVYDAAVQWYRRHRAELVAPDAYLLLDLPPELSDRRTGWPARTAGNPMTFVEHRRTTAAYSEAFRRIREPGCPVYRIDATRPMEDVAQQAQSIIEELHTIIRLQQSIVGAQQPIVGERQSVVPERQSAVREQQSIFGEQAARGRQ